MTDRGHIPALRCLLMAGLLLISSPSRAGSTPLSPALPATNGTVYATYVQDGVLYIAGDFSIVGITVRNGLAAIDTVTRTVVSGWAPDLGAGGVGRVLLPSADGKSLYVGGSFATVGTDPHNLVTEIDIDPSSANYGMARSWDPAMMGTAVYALALSTDGSVVYAGGDYSQVGASARTNLAAIDRVSALATPWVPDPNGIVHNLLASPAGDRLYAGGDFSIIGSGVYGRDSRSAIAALNTTNAAVLAWDAMISGAVPSVHDMLLSDDGKSLTIAGLFDSAGGQARANLARVDSAAAAVDLAWAADTDAAVEVLGISPSGEVLAGGSFITINTVNSRNHLVMLDQADGSVLSWQPLIASSTGPGSVQALAVDDGNGQLYVGGSYGDIGGDTLHNNIAVFAMAPPVTVSASSGGFASSPPLSVTLTCTDNSGNSPCAGTYYTLDGSMPTTASTVYSGDINIAATTTLKYFSVDVDGNPETVHSELYTIESTAPVTTALPVVTVLNTVSYEPVELACDDGPGGSGCAKTYYTVDGSDPTTASTEYTAPIELTDGATTIKYFSVDEADNSEEPFFKTTNYTLDRDLPTISVSHASGNYTPPLTVTISCDDGAGLGCGDIYLNTDGTLPDMVNAQYHYDYSVSGPFDITLNSASILRVQAGDIAGNVGNSVIGIFTFTQADALDRSSSGSGSLSWLPLLLVPLIWRRRIQCRK